MNQTVIRSNVSQKQIKKGFYVESNMVHRPSLYTT